MTSRDRLGSVSWRHFRAGCWSHEKPARLGQANVCRGRDSACDLEPRPLARSRRCQQPRLVQLVGLAAGGPTGRAAAGHPRLGEGSMANGKGEKKAAGPKNTRGEKSQDWDQEVIAGADLGGDSDVRGCMVIKAWGYALWENVQRTLDDMFKATG